MSEPSLPKKAVNLSKTAFDIVKEFVGKGTLLVPEEVRQARIDICNDCNRLDKDRLVCKECGCFLVNKVKFTAAHCPLDYW
tara:strand:- start:930 stop:1172 length:243 start_codon:yes stop_codon:yes gene_type:complete